MGSEWLYTRQRQEPEGSFFAFAIISSSFKNGYKNYTIPLTGDAGDDTMLLSIRIVSLGHTVQV
jgi:hypothetical protein